MKIAMVNGIILVWLCAVNDSSNCKLNKAIRVKIGMNISGDSSTRITAYRYDNSNGHEQIGEDIIRGRRRNDRNKIHDGRQLFNHHIPLLARRAFQLRAQLVQRQHGANLDLNRFIGLQIIGDTIQNGLQRLTIVNVGRGG